MRFHAPAGAVVLLSLGGIVSRPGPDGPGGVGPVPDGVREQLNLSSFYVKHIDVSGFPVVGSAKVSDDAMREAAWIVTRMIGHRQEILHALGANKMRLAVMAYGEFTTDIPEHSDLTPKVYWDRRARGLGATRRRPAVSCAEENLLCFPGDPYPTENICIHEFAHTIHEIGMAVLDPTFDTRLKQAFEEARQAGLWAGTYAATNRSEYWAEGVKSWFDNNRENDALHNHVNTRAELRTYDPSLSKLCDEVFGDGPWRYKKPQDRAPQDRAHLATLDPSKAPRFVWRKSEPVARPRVLIQTAFGDVVVELDAEHAPLTTANFLRYVHEGWYGDGLFHRTVTIENQPDNPVKIEVIQASADPAKRDVFLPPIALERTSQTGLRHENGTISMARDGPDTAQDEFFICVGDQPELDFGGRRNRDGQGFAAFGRVVEGMDVVRKIHVAMANGQSLSPPVKIQRAIRIR